VATVVGLSPPDRRRIELYVEVFGSVALEESASHSPGCRTGRPVGRRTLRRALTNTADYTSLGGENYQKYPVFQKS